MLREKQKTNDQYNGTRRQVGSVWVLFGCYYLEEFVDAKVSAIQRSAF